MLVVKASLHDLSKIIEILNPKKFISNGTDVSSLLDDPKRVVCNLNSVSSKRGSKIFSRGRHFKILSN